MLGGFAFADHRGFRRQYRATAGEDLDLALPAGTATAAGRCDEDAFFRKALHQFAADGNGEFALVVDDDLDVAAGHEP